MTRGKILAASFVLFATLGAGCSATSTVPTTTAADTSSSDTPDTSSSQVSSSLSMSVDEMTKKQVRITTTMGEIVVQFYPDTAPKAVENFLTLAGDGFYDNVIFHRVIETFMIQGGDPLGTGMGGPGYQFADELNDDREYTRGTLAMANSGRNTNGSQFFIMHQDYALPHNYTIFGHVVSGLDVVDAIAATPTNGNDRPLTDVVMESVMVEDIAE